MTKPMKIFHRLLLGASLLGALGAASAAADDARPQTVYILPIQGVIEPALEYVVRRGVSEAIQRDADALIVTMNTPGGTLKNATRIVNLLQNLEMPTYTLVQEQALSAGAIIALSTRQIYMQPGTVIGDAMPILASPFGGVQEMPPDVQEKMVSAVAALIRSAAETGGHDKELAEAMVRRENEYWIGDELISPEGQLLTLTNQEAERMVGEGEDARPLLSSGTVSGLDELLDHIGLAGAERVELQPTGLETLARFIQTLSALFLAAGLFGIYTELKTPGVGLPGILGAVSLAIFFLGHHVAGLAGMEEVALVVLGLALIAVEIFILPGFGIAGISGIVLLSWGLLMAMVQRFPGGPLLPSWDAVEIPLLNLSGAFIITFLLSMVVGRMMPRSRLFSVFRLEETLSTEKGYIASRDQRSLVGLDGVAVTPLRPTGAALVNDQRIDVVTDGLYLEAGTKIRVTEVSGNHIVVVPNPQK